MNPVAQSVSDTFTPLGFRVTLKIPQQSMPCPQ